MDPRLGMDPTLGVDSNLGVASVWFSLVSLVYSVVRAVENQVQTQKSLLSVK